MSTITAVVDPHAVCVIVPATEHRWYWRLPTVARWAIADGTGNVTVDDLTPGTYEVWSDHGRFGGTIPQGKRRHTLEDQPWDDRASNVSDHGNDPSWLLRDLNGSPAAVVTATGPT